MNFPRASGILLHPTSLPGRFGIGDLGDAAFAFADFLAASGQHYWQVLPLGQTGYGDSPYQCFSAFAGNAFLISLEKLVEDDLLSKDDLANAPKFSAERVEFGRVIEYKIALLRRAFDKFGRTPHVGLRANFEFFCRQEKQWLDDYALYRALKDAHGGAAWNTWSPDLARRDEQTLNNARAGLREQIEAQKFYQFLFFKQWTALKDYCHARDIKIIGDIPIFIAYDSADVWTNRQLFKLNSDGTPRVVAGVPPDYYSQTGQLWGNPLYDWEQMKRAGFTWWIERIRATLDVVDIIRLDHFRGFAACWEVPGEDTTAERGLWVETPGSELFTTLKNALGSLPLLAEDLGVITPDVEALRDDFNFPGMRILQFAFGGDPQNRDLPHNYARNCVVYTGTHDNDTTVGWFESQAGAGSTRDAKQIAREHNFCIKYLDSNGTEIHWDFIRAIVSSVADTALIPLQDVLGLGTFARMNLPASESGNWNWRFQAKDLTAEIGARLKELTEIYGRLKTVNSE
ncbi:MAG: 4-alpha-glucanotransferase [Pyrinomonadaceae bacterium]